MINHCEGHVIFQDIEHLLQENTLHQFLDYKLSIKLSLSSEISSTHSKTLLAAFATLPSYTNYLRPNI